MIMSQLHGILSAANGVVSGNDFVSTWKTNNAGVSASNQVTIPTQVTGTYNCSVDWGDGNIDNITTWNDVKWTHTYSSVGTYTIKINGTFIGFRFANGGDRLKILNISQWGTFETNSTSVFWGCENLTVTAIDAPTFSNVSLFRYFRNCYNFNGKVDHWDVSMIQSFETVFENCKLFNQPVNSWDTSIGTNFKGTFVGCSVFNQPLSNWDLSNATTMYAFLSECPLFNQDLSMLDVSNVTIFDYCFQGASAFNTSVNSWDVSSATTMYAMFDSSGYNQPLNSWDVSNVTNMGGMFFDSVFNQNINSWNVSNVTTFELMFCYNNVFNQPLNLWTPTSAVSFYVMFYDCTAFNQNLSSWNVSSVTSFSFMFGYCTSLGQDFSTWNVSSGVDFESMFQATNLSPNVGGWNMGNATTLKSMFEDNANFDDNLSAWNVSKVTNMDYMLRNCVSFYANISSWDVSKVTTAVGFMNGKDTADYAYLDDIYTAWSLLTVRSGVVIDFGTIEYSASVAANKAILTNSPNNWVITDGGTAVVEFRFTVKTNNAGTSSSTQFTIPTMSTGTYNFTVDWGDTTSNNITTWNDAALTHTFPSAGNYTIRITGTFERIRFNNGGDRLKMINIESWGVLKISNSDAFRGCSNMTSSATDVLNFGAGTNCSSSFRDCTLFNGQVDNWNLTGVRYTEFFFLNCSAFNQPCNSWDVSTIEGMRSMFQSTPFNQPLNNWNTSACLTMDRMFAVASSFNQDISMWDVSNVQVMTSMFQLATAFNRDISAWDVSAVTVATNFMLGKTPSNYSAAYLDAIYNTWSTLSLRPNVTIGFGSIKYTAAGSAGRLILTSAPKNWTITDGGI